MKTRSSKRIDSTDLTSGNDGGLMFVPVANSSTVSPTATHFAAFERYNCQNLYEALRDLDEARVEAHDEGFPVPSDAAVKNARWLVYYMYGMLPRRFEVYPTPDGEIAIDVPGGPDHSVLILCNSDGGAQYFGYFDGK